MIKSLDELTAFLKICRKQGVTDINFEGLSVKFGELPTKSRKDDDSEAEAAPEGLTPEQLMYFSVGGAS